MIHHGDSLDVLKTLEANSIDSLVTDPPAGISFMGKSWDGDKGGRAEWITWMSEVMRECYRVLKPGAHGLVWALPRTSHWTAMALEDAGFEIRDCIYHLFGSGFPKSLNIEKAGAGKDWQGFGTALKPAVECWWMIRKPISEKTVAANVLKWGVGGLNIDGTRIGTGGHHGGKTAAGKSSTYFDQKDYVKEPNKIYTQGRFPSHLLLSHSPHCTDTQCDIECAIQMLDGQSPFNKETRTKSPKGTTMNGNKNTHGAMSRVESVNHPGSGHASRFFYCAKVSTSERNKGLDDKNTHPTVKPQKLMRYLCRLVTPPGGTVLDPFTGSGSTGVAALSEGFKFLGIEREDQYVEIANKRLDHACASHRL